MSRPILQTLATFVIASFSLADCQREKAPATSETATVSSPSVDPAAELSRAHDGDARTQLHVGLLYLRGKGVPQDYREARFWIEKAAQQGLVDAQTRQETLYRDGTGSVHDPELARQWLEKAAGQGHAEAQIRLARLLLADNLHTENIAIARQWLEKAAIQGMDEARNVLSGFSADGKNAIADFGKIRS
jgi:hypothetical protein